MSQLSTMTDGMKDGMIYGGAVMGGAMTLVVAGPAMLSAAQTAYYTTELALGGAMQQEQK